MRRLWPALLAVLLLTACHHKSTPSGEGLPATDTATSALVPPCDGTSTVVADSGTCLADDEEDEEPPVGSRRRRVVFSPDQLVGEWQHGSEHEQYMADSTGRRWDTDDDIDRNEAMPFTWTLVDNTLTLLFRLELGGVVPKQYEVIQADADNLVYGDAYGSVYRWSKVPTGFDDRPTAPAPTHP